MENYFLGNGALKFSHKNHKFSLTNFQSARIQFYLEWTYSNSL